MSVLVVPEVPDRLKQAFDEAYAGANHKLITSITRIAERIARSAEQRQNSDLVASETVQDIPVPPVEEVLLFPFTAAEDSPSPGAAEQPQPPMRDVTEAIDRLAALLPDGARREAFKAKVLADFEAAAGISTRPDLTAIRLAAVFEMLKRTSDLGNPKLSATERRRRAKHLLKTYDRLCERDPQFHDYSDALRGARRIVNQDNYRRRKAKQAAQMAAVG